MRLLVTSALAVCLSGCGGPEFRAVEQQPEGEAARVAPAPSAAGVQGDAVEQPASSMISWGVLRGLDARTGKATPQLERLGGTRVRLAGYMVPFSDDLESVTEFLLVPAAGLCVHKPAPPANQIVLVQMEAGVAAVDWTTAVEVTGGFHIDEADSPFGKASYRIAASEIKRW
ncbi:MAG: DUF3299 domain-containing protein [Acidobacteria bacterium]|nr:DUF3299 domain-containing protein [Acidobacteriota bacterium]